MADEPNTISRREFTALSIAAGVTAAAGASGAAAAQMVDTDVQITTPAGVCDAARLRHRAAMMLRWCRRPELLHKMLSVADIHLNKKPRALLADAIVDTVREPLVVLDRDLRVVTASRSFYQTFGVKPENTIGQMFYDLGDGQWNIPALRKLLEEVIPEQHIIEAYEVEHEFPTIGQRVMLLNARQVFDEEHRGLALLLAIEDVTERRNAEREKDELLREKEMLLQEMQHRIGNSLQIIASILLIKARTVQSEETRIHLQEAHQRIMSVATLQQHLKPSALGNRIEIAPYLTKLCESLENSMIADRRPLSLVVQASTGTALSNEAVSIGLIVTELVINALKHAFADGSQGEIMVKYDFDGADWRLSVSDNGMGRQDQGDEPARSGLGTSLIEALARQLDARVEGSSGPRGTLVSIIHGA